MNDEDFFKATGYDPNEYFFASKYMQGGRTVFSLDFSVRELVTFLPKPDPDKPLDAHSTQRRIVPGHARDFGTYIKDDPEWVSPALLLRSPPIFEFRMNPSLDTGTTAFGQLAVPKDARAEIQIVDGQHRTLGFHLGWERLNEEIMQARADLARAKEQGEPALIRVHENLLAERTARREQLSKERVSVQIVIVENPDVARRIFVDINDNAKGITGAVKNRFDDRKVISRALNKVLDTSNLLEGRVDLEQDRVSGSSQYLLGAKHVADILRAITVGNGRIGKRLEEELNDIKIVAEFVEFVEALQSAFPILVSIEDGAVTPAELRATHLIGSNVLFRAFAAAWHDLRRVSWTPERITKSFASFDPYMSAPVYPDISDSWYATGLFPLNAAGSNSPTSRIQDFKTLTTFITDMAGAGEMAEWHRASEADQSLLS